MVSCSSVSDFLSLPETVSIIIKRTPSLEDYLKKNPYIYTTLLNGDFLIGYVNKDNLLTVTDDLGMSLVGTEPIVLGLSEEPEKESILNSTGSIKADKYTGKGVLVGIIDTGIDYTGEAFKNPDNTSRIVSIYDQTVQGNKPFGLGIGTEYTNSQINDALSSGDPLSIVPVTDDTGHGTFLASVAAGKDGNGFTGVAPDAELVVVKLRKACLYCREKYLVPPSQENAFSSSFVMLGVEYIIKKAAELSRPAVILLGLASNFGGHDGQSLFEQYLSQASQKTGICICAAAGNEALEGHHYYGLVSEASPQHSVELKVGENTGDIILNLWCGTTERLSVSAVSPLGEEVGKITARPDLKYEVLTIFDKTLVVFEYNYPIVVNGCQNIIIKLINPSSGIWLINVHAETIETGEFHIWLPVKGFVSPNVEFVNPEKYYTTVTPGTADNLITCGAFNSKDNSLYPKSSWGPTRKPVLKPDIAASGVNVAGIYPSGKGTLSGTGASAAITAGACASLLQWGIVEKNSPDLNTQQIKALLINGAERFEGTEYPNFKWGYGALNLGNTYKLLK